MATSDPPIPKSVPWYLWPFAFLAGPMVLLLGMVLLPLIGLACIVCSPWYFYKQRRIKRENQRLLEQLAEQGRLVELDQIEPTLLNEEGTLLIESRTLAQTDRIWWTPDDVVGQSPLRESISIRKLLSEEEQAEIVTFAKECYQRYIDTHLGTAKLIRRTPNYIDKHYSDVITCQVVRISKDGFQLLRHHSSQDA